MSGAARRNAFENVKTGEKRLKKTLHWEDGLEGVLLIRSSVSRMADSDEYRADHGRESRGRVRRASIALTLPVRETSHRIRAPAITEEPRGTPGTASHVTWRGRVMGKLNIIK